MDYLIPEQLETKRLILRMARLDDLNAIHEYYSDPECTKYTTRRPLSENESWQKLAALAGHWTLRRYGSYVLEEKSLDRVSGIAGLDYPNDWPETEIQWGLARRFWGKGYASEAARAVKEMAANYLPRPSLISLIHPENQNSINLAKSLGASFERELLFKR
ncbi:MAG TPA: GNAT family N-acetyltransferase [Chitinophagaceae bacterium]|nr:GNAT family N-acetyltransferase [Chitinophagaceae bacterium]